MEKQILSAARIEVSVEGLKNFQTFGSLKTSKGSPNENCDKKNVTPTFSRKNSIPDVCPRCLLDYEEGKLEPTISSFIEFEDGTAEETSAPANNKGKRFHKLLKSDEEFTVEKK